MNTDTSHVGDLTTYIIKDAFDYEFQKEAGMRDIIRRIGEALRIVKKQEGAAPELENILALPGPAAAEAASGAAPGAAAEAEAAQSKIRELFEALKSSPGAAKDYVVGKGQQIAGKTRNLAGVGDDATLRQILSGFGGKGVAHVKAHPYAYGAGAAGLGAAGAAAPSGIEYLQQLLNDQGEA